MSEFKLIGQNYTTPDLVAKVTGAAMYAEDFRVDGMLYCRLLVSPRPHARVRRIDTSEALKLAGVKAIVTADDLPAPVAPSYSAPPPKPAGSPVAAPPAARPAQTAVATDEHGQPIQTGAGAAPKPAPKMTPEGALTMEPVYAGEPIAAVAAVDEATAVAAIERIKVVFEPLPFVIDPLDSLRPGGPNARREGNVLRADGTFAEIKWNEAELAELENGQLPMGSVPKDDQWSYGDVDAEFKRAALVVDESFVIPIVSHMTLERRSSLAYWRDGRLYVHCPTQGFTMAVPAIARYMGLDPSRVVFISPYTGGGFGSKILVNQYIVIPAVLAKKTGQPVMLVVTRDDELSIGRTRPGMLGRAKVGFGRDGRITALDLFLVSNGGPYGRGDHAASAGRGCRWRRSWS